MISQSLIDILNSFYSDEGIERVGFIKGEHNIVEVKNNCDKPMDGFKVSTQDLITHTEDGTCWATWHTHPKDDANLSGEDYRSFKSYPDYTHFIIGKDGVRAFKWNEDKKALVEVEW